MSWFTWVLLAYAIATTAIGVGLLLLLGGMFRR